MPFLPSFVNQRATYGHLPIYTCVSLLVLLASINRTPVVVQCVVFSQSQPTRPTGRERLIPVTVALAVQLGLLVVSFFVIIVRPMQSSPGITVVVDTEPAAPVRVDFARELRPLEQTLMDSALAMPDLADLADLPELTTVTADDVLQLDAAVFTMSAAELPEMAWQEPAPFSLLGIEDQSERIVVCFDISTSVVNNMAKADMAIDRVLEATKAFIEQLDANTVVGLIQFSRRYETYAEHLVPVTQANRKRLIEWLDNEFVRSGSSQPDWVREHPDGIQSVLRAAFAMEPDIILILSDASFQRERGANVPWDELAANLRQWQSERAQEVRLHFIGFGVSEANAAAMRDLVQRWQGCFSLH